MPDIIGKKEFFLKRKELGSCLKASCQKAIVNKVFY